MPTAAPPADLGRKAPAFRLPATDGNTYALADIARPAGTLVMFICNHCPYVLSVLPRLVADARELMGKGIGVAAICSNDAVAYPQDGFDKMAELARDHAFPFPYLHDQTQEVARAWGAACTPDFFGLNGAGELQYRGRLDAAGRAERPADMRRDLVEAMLTIARTGRGPQDQVPSMGCSIKWAS